MSFQDTVQYYLDDAQEWCRGKSFPWRALLLAYFAQAGVHSVFDPEYNSWFAGITFGIHELGHVIFGFLGEFLSVFGGTFWQLAAPTITIVLFLFQREYFGMAIGGSWLSTSLASVATYMSDARAQNLPLVGLSDDPLHDWNYLLSAIGLLSWDTKLAFLVQCLALIVVAVSTGWGAWLCYVMYQNRSETITNH